jgi:hypothetical protein
MAQQSLEPTQSQVPAPRAAEPATTAVGASARLKRALELEKAAMLAEFNGTYDLAKKYRDAAARLRNAAHPDLP